MWYFKENIQCTICYTTEKFIINMKNKRYKKQHIYIIVAVLNNAQVIILLQILINIKMHEINSIHLNSLVFI